jgi:sterol desaturase/sphingolipid hydroxylase (fatty acid hydroxylase superfamily)
MLQDAWTWLLAEASPRVVDTWIPFGLFVVTYWVGGFALLALECPWAMPWARAIKCQPSAPPMPWADVRKIGKRVGLQQLTVYPAAQWALRLLVRGRCSFAPALPTAAEAVSHLLFFGLMAEIYFYHVHRLLHHPRLYPWVHKIHHEFTAPISLEAMYFHPVESVLNIGVLLSGPLCLGSHITLVYAFTVIAVLNVLVHHCGHEVPLDSPPFFGSMTHQHDYHHKVFNRNFGVIGICDWLYGTRAGYDEYHARWELARQQAKVE